MEKVLRQRSKEGLKLSSTALAGITDRARNVILGTQAFASPAELPKQGQRALNGETVGIRDQRGTEEERETKMVGTESRRRKEKRKEGVQKPSERK